MSFLDLLKLLSAPFRLPVGAVTLLTVGPVTFLVASGGVVVGSIAVSKTFGTPVRSIDPDAQLFIDAAQGIFTSLSAFSNPFLTSDTLDKIFDNENSKSPEVTFSELEKFHGIGAKPDFIDEKTYKTIKKAFDSVKSSQGLEGKKEAVKNAINVMSESITSSESKESMILKPNKTLVKNESLAEGLTNEKAKGLIADIDKENLVAILSNKENYKEFKKAVTNNSNQDSEFHKYLQKEKGLTDDDLKVILSKQNNPSPRITKARLSNRQLPLQQPPISRHQ